MGRGVWGNCFVCLRPLSTDACTWDDALMENVHEQCVGQRPRPKRRPRQYKNRANPREGFTSTQRHHVIGDRTPQR